MTTESIPVVEAQMLIRQPREIVFQAFIDPAVTTKFWFTKSTGILEAGKRLTWTWEMYNVSNEVMVKEIMPYEQIVLDWGDPATTIEFHFREFSHNATYVVIRNYGFRETGAALWAAICDNTGGFTTVIDGLKAYLEHNIQLNLIADKFPKEAAKHGQ